MLDIKDKALQKNIQIVFKKMKLPWFSSEKSSKKNPETKQKNEKKETKKTYKLSSLPENLQKIAILIKKADKEIQNLQMKLQVTSKAKKELEKELSRELNSIKD